MTEYPVHRKLKAVRGTSQSIGEFMEWLKNEKCVCFTRPHEHTDHCSSGWCEQQFDQVYTSTNDFLAEYFDIDTEALEDEKQAMLTEVREARDA